MRESRKILSFVFVFALFTLSTHAETAAPPLLVKGEACPAGSKRPYKWILFEDQNQDGSYDFVVAGDCNGDVRGRPWRAGADPLDPTVDDIIIGQLPIEVADVSPTLIITPITGGYRWTISDRTPSGAEVCRYERGPAGALTSTCPPAQGDGNLH